MEKTECRLNVTVTREVECNYLVYLPQGSDAEDERGSPLMLFLHGAGERGEDLDSVKVHGPPRRIEEGAELPFIVVAPQCAAGQWWEAEVLGALLSKIEAEHNVDPCRVYVTGLSMGGQGAWALGDTFPGRFAAIAPICGPLVRGANPRNFLNVPVWCFHGAMDSVVNIEDSVAMVRMLRDAGCEVRFTVYPDANHDSWTETYDNPELYEWFLQHPKRGQDK